MSSTKDKILGAFYLKLHEDAEIMTQKEFINEWGGMYLEFYEASQLHNQPEYDDE
tara:strand:- start:223 stop:387 length:165 start_codon:yes stop_codon:yes gene_type:complete